MRRYVFTGYGVLVRICFISDGGKGSKKPSGNGYSDFRQIVSTLIREGIERDEFQPHVDIESVAAALVGTWDALLLQAWFDDDFNPSTAARGFMTVVINGLTAKPQVV